MGEGARDWARGGARSFEQGEKQKKGESDAEGLSVFHPHDIMPSIALFDLHAFGSRLSWGRPQLAARRLNRSVKPRPEKGELLRAIPPLLFQNTRTHVKHSPRHGQERTNFTQWKNDLSRCGLGQPPCRGLAAHHSPTLPCPFTHLPHFTSQTALRTRGRYRTIPFDKHAQV
jgi:hypothetical protein